MASRDNKRKADRERHHADPKAAAKKARRAYVRRVYADYYSVGGGAAKGRPVPELFGKSHGQFSDAELGFKKADFEALAKEGISIASARFRAAMDAETEARTWSAKARRLSAGAVRADVLAL